MLGDRVAGIDIDHGARDRVGGERIVGGELDQAITLGQRRANDRDRTDHRHVARGDVQIARTDCADPESALSAGSLLNPTVEIGNAHRTLDQGFQIFSIEHARQLIVDVPQHRLGETPRLKRQLESLLHVRIREGYARSDFRQKIQDTGHRRILQIAQAARVAEHEIVNVFVRIGASEPRARTAAKFDRIRPRLDDSPAGDDRNVESGLHKLPSRMTPARFIISSGRRGACSPGRSSLAGLLHRTQVMLHGSIGHRVRGDRAIRDAGSRIGGVQTVGENRMNISMPPPPVTSFVNMGVDSRRGKGVR